MERMTAKEYAELRALASEEVIGADREDARQAIVGYALHRVAGGTSHLSDFVPKQLEVEATAQTLDEMEATLLSLIPVDHGDTRDNQHQSGT